MTQELLDTPLAELEGYGLSVRVISRLEDRFGLYVRDLDGVSVADLRAVPNIGPKAAASIRRALRAMGAGEA